MKNKRGFLLGEFTLKVIIAILCIIILVFLLYKLYGVFTTSSDLDKAKTTLDKVIESANSAILNPAQPSTYILVSPKDWVLTHYTSGQVAPRSCSSSSCLCVCPKVKFYNFNDQLSKCDTEGICKVPGFQIEFGEDIPIGEPVTLNFKKTETGVSITR